MARKKKVVSETATIRLKRFDYISPYVREDEQGRPEPVSGHVRGREAKEETKSGGIFKSNKNSDNEKVKKFIRATEPEN